MTPFQQQLLDKLDKLIAAVQQQSPADFSVEDKIVRGMTIRDRMAKKNVQKAKQRIPTETKQ
jgi:hypothetical protein